MATRFFFPATEASDVNPSFGAWTDVSQGIRRKMQRTKGTSAIAAGQTVNLSGTAGDKDLDRQYVSEPLAGAQTITGTVQGQLAVREFAVSDNVDSISIILKVVSRDGGTLRGTLLALGNYSTIAEFINNASMRNKKIADGDTVTSVSALDGDRIVLEIGYTNTTAGTTPQAAAKWGENAADLPIDETTTTDGAGWFEFSQNLFLAEDAAVGARVSELTGVAPRQSASVVASGMAPGYKP